MHTATCSDGVHELDGTRVVFAFFDIETGGGGGGILVERQLFRLRIDLPIEPVNGLESFERFVVVAAFEIDAPGESLY